MRKRHNIEGELLTCPTYTCSCAPFAPFNDNADNALVERK
jgi:hypothetical protein